MPSHRRAPHWTADAQTQESCSESTGAGGTETFDINVVPGRPYFLYVDGKTGLLFTGRGHKPLSRRHVQRRLAHWLEKAGPDPEETNENHRKAQIQCRSTDPNFSTRALSAVS